MKLFFKTFAFNLFCILIFAFIYHIYSKDFTRTDGKSLNHTFFDCISLSTTVQVGVGLTNMYPTTNHTKMILNLQQLMMLSSHLFTIYIFTL